MNMITVEINRILGSFRQENLKMTDEHFSIFRSFFLGVLRSLWNFDIEKDKPFLRKMNSYFNGCEGNFLIFIFIHKRKIPLRYIFGISNICQG